MPEFLRILIVDDDPEDREIFCEVAKEIDAAIECSQAKNGEDALKMLQKATALPDYIFLDLNMPRMNGKQCLKKIKANSALQTIPVIIYSTSKLKDDIEETKSSGAAAFISKPTELKALEDTLRYVFSHY